MHRTYLWAVKRTAMDVVHVRCASVVKSCVKPREGLRSCCMRFCLSMGVLNRHRQRTEHYSACTALRCGIYTSFGCGCLGLAVVKPLLIQVCLQGAATRRAGLTGLQMAHHVNAKGAKEVCVISLLPPLPAASLLLGHSAMQLDFESGSAVLGRI